MSDPDIDDLLADEPTEKDKEAFEEYVEAEAESSSDLLVDYDKIDQKDLPYPYNGQPFGS